jgi:hypothetical protein
MASADPSPLSECGRRPAIRQKIRSKGLELPDVFEKIHATPWPAFPE